MYFGRYSEEKGVSTLIKVCEQLPDICFVFAGAGPLENKIDSLKNVKNVGFQRGGTLGVLIKGAEFTVYPSEWYENCPFSVMESQVYGTPVLATNIGGLPELVDDGITGELFERGNEQEIKGRIQRLWENKRLIQLYCQNCLETEICDEIDYYKKILKIYSEP